MKRVVDGRVIDAGWLGHTGVGRVTELFLRGATAAPPPGQWTVWGPPDVARYAWPGVRVVPTRHPPMAWAAQRDIAAVPGGTVLHLHAVRPLAVWRRAVVVVHDTIPLRWDYGVRRAWWTAFLRASARSSLGVIAVSAATADRVCADLHVPPTRTRVVEPTVDREFTARVLQARESTQEDPVLLYVGQLKRHKNLPAAIEAFARTAFAREGGRFVIIGGTAEQHARLTEAARADASGQVVHVPRVSDEELVAWYTRARAVILPSLEEGFGLTIVEALASGIPVCCSDIEPLRTASRGLAELFDPLDVASIARGIDRAVTAPAPPAIEVDDVAAYSGRILAAFDELT